MLERLIIFLLGFGTFIFVPYWMSFIFNGLDDAVAVDRWFAGLFGLIVFSIIIATICTATYISYLYIVFGN